MTIRRVIIDDSLRVEYLFNQRFLIPVSFSHENKNYFIKNILRLRFIFYRKALYLNLIELSFLWTPINLTYSTSNKIFNDYYGCYKAHKS